MIRGLATRVLKLQAAGVAASLLSIGAATALLGFSRTHTTGAASLGLLLVVLFIASGWGSKSALVAAVLAALAYNYFFLGPGGSLSLESPEEWIAFSAFVITALTAGQLSGRSRRRAEEAEKAGAEIARLYEELRLAFERASETEALRRSEQLKSALLDAVTHDLRTPLTSIKASVTTLLGETPNGQAPTKLDAVSERELLDVINEETDRLDRLINNLVEMARIEAGELALRPAWADAAEIAAQAVARMPSSKQRARVQLSIERGLPALKVDGRAISQVLYLLLENSCKYAFPNTFIHAGVKSAGEAVEFAVEDCGPGVPIEQRARVFEKFYRGGASHEVPRRAGLGMGLAIARGIVEAHGGKIWIEDARSRRGTRVVFTLPVHTEYRPAGAVHLGAA